MPAGDPHLKGRGGVAALSRTPFAEVQIGLAATEFELHGRYLEVDVDSLTGALTVGSVYVHTGEAGTERQLEKERFMAALAKRMAELSADGRDAVICGDWNIAHTENDSSQLLRIPAGSVEQMVVIGAAPGLPKGLFLSSYENDEWMFTVWGMLEHEPPAELAGMLSFAEEYAPAHVPSAVRAAQPLGEVARHRPSSQWRRYDKMRRFPDGLLVCGDAICSFNPVYGQGMTLSALDAAAMRNCLGRGANDLPRRYFRTAAKSIALAWRMAAGNDLGFPDVEGRRSLSTRMANRCADWVLTACESDIVIAILQGQQLPRLPGPPPASLVHLASCDGQHGRRRAVQAAAAPAPAS